MGSPESENGRLSDEGPQIEVTVEPFWMVRPKSPGLSTRLS